MKTVFYPEKNSLDTWMALLTLVYAGAAAIIGQELGANYYFPYLYIGAPVLWLFFLWRFIYKIKKGVLYWAYLLFLTAIMIWWVYHLLHPNIWFLQRV